MSEQIVPLRDLLPDPANANLGTERGREVLRKSLEKFGAGRSVLLDGKNRLIAGNKATEQAIAAGLEEALVIETDGSRLVAVKRRDLDLDDPQTRELAFFDNRSSELDLSWSVEAIDAALKAEVDLSALWTGDELEALLKDAPAFPEFDENSFADVGSDTTAVTFHVPLSALGAIEAGIEQVMERFSLEKREKWRVLEHLLGIREPAGV